MLLSYKPVHLQAQQRLQEEGCVVDISKPPEYSRVFHLSLTIYAMTIIVFEAKTRYAHWNSESTHYGHHLRLVVIIQSRAHRTTLYLLMTLSHYHHAHLSTCIYSTATLL